jgi:hypothetical protein
MTRIFCQTRFEGFHNWPNAPKEVDFLAVNHRHEFHVKAWKNVTHEDRQTEFILFKRFVENNIKQVLHTNDVGHWSCETWARVIAELSLADTVEVSEDGENGAEWSRDNNDAHLQQKVL